MIFCFVFPKLGLLVEFTLLLSYLGLGPNVMNSYMLVCDLESGRVMFNTARERMRESRPFFVLRKLSHREEKQVLFSDMGKFLIL